MTKSRGINKPKRQWTAAELELVRRRYPDEPGEALAAEIGCRLLQLYSLAKRMGVRKSEAFLASAASGRLDGVKGSVTRFAPGRTPWTKGKKMPPGWGGPTTFKPGDVPANVLPVGFVRDTRKDGYLEIKVAEGIRQWVLLHRHVWKQHHGCYPPKTHRIEFKDKNPKNCDISNLTLITLQEHMARHTIARFPPELRSAIHLVKKVQRQLDEQQVDQ